MKSSASAIAQSLSDFGRVLRETELPNDVETTARILQIQTAERDAIKVSSSLCLHTFEATQVKGCRCLLGGLSNICAKGIVSAARCASDRVETQTRTPQPNQVTQRDGDRTDAGPARFVFQFVLHTNTFLTKELTSTCFQLYAPCNVIFKIDNFNAIILRSPSCFYVDLESFLSVLGKR